MSWRRFYFKAARSDKFWCIRPLEEERCHEVWFGRSGTAGQHRLKQYASSIEMFQGIERIIDQKINKGYVEVTAEMQQTQEVAVRQTSTARVVVVPSESNEPPRREIVFE